MNHLAVENFKFLLPLFPIALAAGGGLGAEVTLDRIDKLGESSYDSSLLQKAGSGIKVSIIFLGFYSSFRLLGMRTGYRGCTSLAAFLLIACAVNAVAAVIHLTKRIDQDVEKSPENIGLLFHNVAAVMVSALVGAVGLILFETIANTYLGKDLKAIYIAANKGCRLCSFVGKI